MKTANSTAETTYRLRTKNSEKEFQAARKVMPGGVTRNINYFHPYPLIINKADGPIIFDADDNRYIDFINNYGSIIHGHTHPAIIKRVQEAVKSGSAMAATVPEQIEFAQMLCDRIPSMDQIRFCNSGLEATLFALRAARAYTGKSAFIKMEGGYHGLHDAVEFSVHPPVTGDSKTQLEAIPSTAGVSKYAVQDVYIAPFNNVRAIENILIENAHEIAAIIVEPVMGVAGMITPLPGYLAELRRLADEYDTLLIFDEVQTLRLDIGGAQEFYNVLPDLTAIGKIIGGGYPVGAFGGRKDIMSLFDPSQDGCVSHSGTFSGNNITMAAGITAMQLLDKVAISHLEELSAHLQKGMEDAIQRFSIPACVSRAGSMLQVHFTNQVPIDYATTNSSFNDLANLVHMELLNHGIYATPRGTWYLSTVMTKEQIDETIKSFTDVMQKIASMI